MNQKNVSVKNEMVLTDDTQSYEQQKKCYRTKKLAGAIDEIPEFVLAITNKEFQNALTFKRNDTAYLQQIRNEDMLQYSDVDYWVDGKPAEARAVKKFFTATDCETFDLPLLRVCFTILFKKLEKSGIESASLHDVVTIYYPDLAKKLGKSANTSKNDICSCIKIMKNFENLVGEIDRNKRSNKILPVITKLHLDEEKNTICFASPYLVHIIQAIHQASIRKAKKGQPSFKSNGLPNRYPAYSYLIKSSIAKEQNKRAVEIVFCIVELIEQCGNNEPHIKAGTVIDRIPALGQAIQNCATAGNKNNQLKRAFSKAWELLITQTNLSEKYQNIMLPCPEDGAFKEKWIPTSSTLDKVFRFPHDGKRNDT